MNTQYNTFDMFTDVSAFRDELMDSIVAMQEEAYKLTQMSFAAVNVEEAQRYANNAANLQKAIDAVMWKLELTN